MSSGRSMIELARHAITTACFDFGGHAQLNEPDFSASNLSSGPLCAAAETSLVALAEFGLADDLTFCTCQSLRSAIQLVNRRHQVQSLKDVLDDPALFTPADGGWKSVRGWLDGRIQRSNKKLRKLHQRLVTERFLEQIDRLKVNPELPSTAEGLRKMARATLNDALSRVLSAAELESPSLTLIDELHASLTDLDHKLTVYCDVFDSSEDRQRLTPQLTELQSRMLDVDQFALMKARCTKWLEKKRDPDAILVLRELTQVCRTHYQRAFGELADYLTPHRLSQFQVSFSGAIDRLVEPR